MGSGSWFGAAVSRRRVVGALAVALATVAGAVFVPTVAAAGPPMTVQVVVENPGYEILAVDPSGMTYGEIRVRRQRDLEVSRQGRDVVAGAGRCR